MRDFVKAWTKVMNADRFDLSRMSVQAAAGVSPRQPATAAAAVHVAEGSCEASSASS